MGLEIPNFGGNLGAKLTFWAPTISSVGNLLLSVRKLQLLAPSTFFNPRRRCRSPRLAWALDPVIHLTEDRRLKPDLQVDIGTRQVEPRARNRADCDVEWLVSYQTTTGLLESRWFLPQTPIASTVEDSQHFGRVLEAGQWRTEVRIWQRFLFKPYSHTTVLCT